DRAGTIVFADVMYPGWICKVDGVPIPLKSYDGLFRSVIVNDGNHIIELNYRPVLLYIGLAVSVVTWVLLVAILLYYFKKKKHHVV
ncbi:MAG TPA: YfhO family protein, partial [Anaerolineaceae bacterium]|nr:YfhO family protein [Anaerolineaceae bacterium]